jgi:hypothetical protein
MYGEEDESSDGTFKFIDLSLIVLAPVVLSLTVLSSDTHVTIATDT